MLDFLDRTLKSLFESRLPVSVGFDPPNDHWRTTVSSTGGNFLNVYLVELRENRKLRSNELVSEWVGNVLEQEMAPTRLDCHYLVSAWTPAGVNPNPLVEATVDEQVILYDATKVLLDSLPLDVNALYPSALIPPAPPPEMLEQPLPATVAPPEGFAKLPDFWMRMDWVWKPVIELIVTIPVVAVARPAGPPVTTLLSRYLQNGRLPSVEELITIGGVVRTGSPATVVANAWVRIVELDRIVMTNLIGQFVFAPVARGQYHLESSAPGHALTTRPIEVPSLSGEYDLALL
jgi:hypothetical protein